METLCIARQALHRFAHPCTTLNQAGCHRDAQQKSCARAERSFFPLHSEKGEVWSTWISKTKMLPLPKRGTLDVHTIIRKQNSLQKLFTFHTELPWDILCFNLEFMSCGPGRALNAHVVFRNQNQNWNTWSFCDFFQTVNLLLEFASCKQRFPEKSSHQPC